MCFDKKCEKLNKIHLNWFTRKDNLTIKLICFSTDRKVQ